MIKHLLVRQILHHLQRLGYSAHDAVASFTHNYHLIVLEFQFPFDLPEELQGCSPEIISHECTRIVAANIKAFDESLYGPVHTWPPLPEEPDDDLDDDLSELIDFLDLGDFDPDNF